MISPEARRPEITAVYGGGGPFGIGYGAGVAETLIEHGVPLQEAPALGTSAGSWVASMIATGVTVERMLQELTPKIPDYTPGLLQSIANEVFEDTQAPSVHASTVRLGLFPRMDILDGQQHGIAEMVAASSAIPCIFHPVRIEGNWHVDGGVRSGTSIDLAASARNLLVIAPVAGPVGGPIGRLFERVTRREMDTWQQENDGAPVSLIRPNAEIASLIRTPLDLFNPRIANEAYELGKEQTRQLIKENRITILGNLALNKATAA